MTVDNDGKGDSLQIVAENTSSLHNMEPGEVCFANTLNYVSTISIEIGPFPAEICD